jgi:fatty acid desaturase
MYAGVPCYNLKKLHKLVADDMPEPRSLTSAWREIIEVQRRQKSEPGYEFDTPVPPSAVAQSVEVDDLAASIGDLAPEALA